VVSPGGAACRTVGGVPVVGVAQYGAAWRRADCLLTCDSSLWCEPEPGDDTEAGQAQQPALAEVERREQAVRDLSRGQQAMTPGLGWQATVPLAGNDGTLGMTTPVMARKVAGRTPRQAWYRRAARST